MRENVLQCLADAQAALAAALDARDVDALDAATAAVAVAVDEVRVVGAWREHAGLRDNVAFVLNGADAVRGRVNALADLNRRKLNTLISLAGAAPTAAYDRRGKLG